MSNPGISGDGLVFDEKETKFWQTFSTIIADATDPTNTAVFNPAKESTNIAGAVNKSAYNEYISVKYIVPTLGSTGINITVWGCDGLNASGVAEWELLYTEVITSTNSVWNSFAVEERPNWIRIGYQSTGTDGTDVVSVSLFGRGNA